MIEEWAYAKINLELNILGRRSDGYHEVDMIMQTVDFADKVYLEESDREGIFLQINLPELANQDNLAVRAARLLALKLGITPRVQITIDKQIFMEAGLAGGSSDCAAVLRGLNRLWHLGYTYGELENIGAQLGSDVPFMIQGGTARARGRGEILEHLADESARQVLLAKPKGIGISTPWAYRQFDKLPACPGEPGENVLERVAFGEYPLLGEMKLAALEAGAEKALMSGSGPTMFAIGQNEDVIGKVAKAWSGYDVDMYKCSFRGRIK